MQITIGNKVLECIEGNIVKQDDCQAIVNAANAQLRTGGGVAGAIHRAAGPGLEEECRSKAPIEPGQAVISGGHDLPNEYVIHCLGPVYGQDEPADEILANCYRNSLKLADQYQVTHVAFPAISTGAFGYPIEEAASVAINTSKDELPGLAYVEVVRFVLFGKQDEEVFERIMNALDASKQ